LSTNHPFYCSATLLHKTKRYQDVWYVLTTLVASLLMINICKFYNAACGSWSNLGLLRRYNVLCHLVYIEQFGLAISLIKLAT
jgi:hypothetical protein